MQVWWSQSTAWWSTWTRACLVTSRAMGTVTPSLCWCGKMSCLRSLLRQRWWLWDTHAAQPHRPVVRSTGGCLENSFLSIIGEGKPQFKKKKKKHTLGRQLQVGRRTPWLVGLKGEKERRRCERRSRQGDRQAALLLLWRWPSPIALVQDNKAFIIHNTLIPGNCYYRLDASPPLQPC